MVTFPGNLLYFIPAGIYTFGITITNLVQIAIDYFFSLSGVGSSRRENFRRLFLFLFTVVLFSVLFNFFRFAFIRSGSFFFIPDVYKGNFTFVQRSDDSRLDKALLLAENFFLYNIAGPNLYITLLGTHDNPLQNLPIPAEILKPNKYNQSTFATYVASSVKYASITVYSAWLIWIVLVVLGIVGIIRRRLYLTPLVQAIVLCLLFNMIFHFFWGWDTFLYTTHWTLMIVLLAAYGIGNSKYELLIQFFLVSLMLLLAWNDAIFISRLSSIFSG